MNRRIQIDIICNGKYNIKLPVYYSIHFIKK